MKHIDIQHHFVRDIIHRGEVRLEWIETGDQVADILTKALDKQTFKRLREKLLRTSEITHTEGGDRQ